MLNSLFSGASGVKSHRVSMDVIGNNIANVNTTAFKGSKTNFQDVLYLSIRAGGEERSPDQVGVGVSVASIASNTKQGALQSSGRTMDLAINGSGFFVVKDTAGNEKYTRNGVFFLNDQGYLINAEGLRVQSAKGDVRIFNGPVSAINIAANGEISGTNMAGEPLQFSSTPLVIPAATAVTEAQLTGEKLAKIKPVVTDTGAVLGDTIKAATTPVVEAVVQGNKSEVEPKLATAKSVNMSNAPAPAGIGQVFTLVYNDGATDITVVLNDATSGSPGYLGDVRGWHDLVTKLQARIDASAAADKVKVSYQAGPFGGLKFETVTNPDVIPAVTPQITLQGADKFMGSIDDNVNTGSPVVASTEWVDKTFNFDAGQGWQEVKLNDDLAVVAAGGGGSGTTFDFDNITSGENLAMKLNNLFHTMAGGTGLTLPPADNPDPNSAILSVSWNEALERLEFRADDPNQEIKLGGANITDFIGNGVDVTSSTVDWTTKDFNIIYNGVNYTFSTGDKEQAGLGIITKGEDLAAAMNKLLDDKIGADKIDVTWSTDRLVFQTKDTTGVGIQPSITIGGADAAAFVGASTSAKGVASMLPDIATQAPYNLIRLATFQVPEGLIQAGNSLFKKSASSGMPTYGTANTHGFGSINSGFLEMSNVDLTEEFTNMITTQRGFQANARTITVSDSLLEELVNLKR